MRNQLYLFPDVENLEAKASLDKLRRSVFARLNDLERRILDLENTLAELEPKPQGEIVK